MFINSNISTPRKIFRYWNFKLTSMRWIFWARYFLIWRGFFGPQGLYQGPFWLTLCRLVLTLSLRWLFCEWVTATLPLNRLRAVAPPPPNPTLSWRLPLEKMTIRWGCSFWLNQSAKSNKNHYKTCAMFRWKKHRLRRSVASFQIVYFKIRLHNSHSLHWKK